MSEIHVTLGRVAGIVSMLAFVPYWIDIVRRRTVPSRASWWIWLVVGVLLGASYFASGARSTIWVSVSYVIGPLVTALLAIKFGEGGWTKFDRWCLAGAAVSVALWAIFRSPLVALIMLIVIDGFGVPPTVKKAYLNPKSENALAWSLFVLGNLLNLVAVDKWNFANATYTIYMALASGAIAMLVIWPRRIPARSDNK